LKTNTLLVDGDNLLTIGFFGLKNHFYKGQHIGGIYHFLNTLRRTFDTYFLDKICVFWDGDDSGFQRRKFYAPYKQNRNNRLKSEEEINAYNRQRNRIKQYLEEIYVRQGEYEHCETDDCIAYYVQNAPNEKITIYSSDRDLTQLVRENVFIYSPSHQKVYGPGSVMEYDHEDILIENVKLVKILCGDQSDNIHGIRNMGVKTLIKLYPEIQTNVLTLEDIIEKTKLLFEEDKKSVIIQNLLTGVSKLGVFGDEFYEINYKLIDLSTPLLTDDARSGINDLIHENLDTEGRSYKNAMKLMQDDGLFLILQQQHIDFVKYFTPFLRLTQKEKNKHYHKAKK